MTPDEKRHVTVEDLLRLKRVERPAPEFWGEFERELRAKQLAALVERRPWWRDLPVRFAGFRRYHLPLATTAVLAITFVTVRNYEPADIEHPAGQVAVHANPTATEHVGDTSVVPASANLGASSAASREQDASAIRDYSAADIVAGAESTLETGTASVGMPPRIPLLWESGAAPDESLTPSARSIAANLAAAEAAEPAVVRRLLGARHGFELGRSELRSAVEPLQQMPSPAEVRLARFDSPLARTASVETPARTNGRVARDLDVYERAARRIGGGGDRLTVKF
ncbi:MAG: hypothetical protein WD941_03240 [Opitutus sp.]